MNASRVRYFDDFDEDSQSRWFAEGPKRSRVAPEFDNQITMFQSVMASAGGFRPDAGLLQPSFKPVGAWEVPMPMPTVTSMGAALPGQPVAVSKDPCPACNGRKRAHTCPKRGIKGRPRKNKPAPAPKVLASKPKRQPSPDVTGLKMPSPLVGCNDQLLDQELSEFIDMWAAA
eukprot:CAMPEP_0172652504 /NCGR_PEP_ID=MMETSP1068-20121228/243348_1 /TAXON_ID=35684 /ORGANISM="Pseudopedinella elastica, Strain CCMP716" /LENGTH=172 /DNA_ID=CAMNT_0013466913 /DNA_START=133 /DNA_END=651 /DNA_ORIENTATION=-